MTEHQILRPGHEPTTENRPLVPIHPRRRWPWIAGGAAATAGMVTAGLLLLGANPGLTPACQAAVDRQDRFVASAVANGYPDGVSIAQYMAIQAADLKIINDGMKVCPGDTKIRTLPNAG